MRPSDHHEMATRLALAWRSTLTAASWAMRNSSRSCGRGSRPVGSPLTVTSMPLRCAQPVAHGPQCAQDVEVCGDLGAQLVERLPHLADHAPDVVAQPGQLAADVVAALGGPDEPVELEGEVGERLADAVVEVAGERLRSSSAPTVRSRANQRALSMASAAGST